MHRDHKRRAFCSCFMCSGKWQNTSSASYSTMPLDRLTTFCVFLTHKGWKLKLFQQLSQSLPLQTGQSVEMLTPSLSDQNNKHPAEQLLHTNRTRSFTPAQHPIQTLLPCKSPTLHLLFTFTSVATVDKGGMYMKVMRGLFCCRFLKVFLAGY